MSLSKNSSEKKKTKLINARVSYLRPRYNDLADWMKKKNHVYIGRGRIVFIDKNKIEGGPKLMSSVQNDEHEVTRVRFPFKDSPWANPFKSPRDGTLFEVLAKYHIYIQNKIKNKEVDLEEIRGKTLACWCVKTATRKVKSQDKWTCHGECLLSLLDETDSS
jgi:Domain of unknown function (DUF4326)